MEIDPVHSTTSTRPEDHRNVLHRSKVCTSCVTWATFASRRRKETFFSIAFHRCFRKDVLHCTKKKAFFDSFLYFCQNHPAPQIPHTFMSSTMLENTLMSISIPIFYLFLFIFHHFHHFCFCSRNVIFVIRNGFFSRLTYNTEYEYVANMLQMWKTYKMYRTGQRILFINEVEAIE